MNVYKLDINESVCMERRERWEGKGFTVHGFIARHNQVKLKGVNRPERELWEAVVV
jgi:hypothetical protein